MRRLIIAAISLVLLIGGCAGTVNIDMSRPDAVKERITLSTDEISLLKSEAGKIWPLKDIKMGDMGTLVGLNYMLAAEDDFMTLIFHTDKPYEELQGVFKDYISGDFLPLKGITVVKGTAEESKKLDVTIYDGDEQRELLIKFSSIGLPEGVRTLIEKHWPHGAVKIPSLLDNAKAAKAIYLNTEKISFAQEWQVDDAQKVLSAFADTLSDSANYVYTPDFESGDSYLTCTVGGANIEVSVLADNSKIDLIYYQCTPGGVF
jgi:hypothetical protein